MSWELLLLDADLLVRQYQKRDDKRGFQGMSLEQRRAWAAEAAAVLEALADELHQREGGPARRISPNVFYAWNAQIERGERLATRKASPAVLAMLERSKGLFEKQAVDPTKKPGR